MPAESHVESVVPEKVESIASPVHPSRYLRFELARDQASMLLDELQGRGVDAVTLFPGNHGFVLAARVPHGGTRSVFAPRVRSA